MDQKVAIISNYTQIFNGSIIFQLISEIRPIYFKQTFFIIELVVKTFGSSMTRCLQVPDFNSYLQVFPRSLSPPGNIRNVELFESLKCVYMNYRKHVL